MAGRPICWLGFVRLLVSDRTIAKDPQQLYRYHCSSYGLTPNTVKFFFMSHVDELYVAIADDGKPYSYVNGTRKSISLLNIDRCEGRGLDDTNKSKYLTVVVYEKNGNHHNYNFSRGTDDFSHFVACLNAVIEFNNKPMEYMEEAFERDAQLFKLGGETPKFTLKICT